MSVLDSLESAPEALTPVVPHSVKRFTGDLAFRGRDFANDLLRRLEWMRNGSARPNQQRDEEGAGE